MPTSDDLMLVIPDSEREARINKQVRQILRPWLKTPPPISTDVNRLKAHEKLVHEQNKMIKEQKKIIDDLQYQQNQQIFKEQIALLEQIKQKQEELEKMQKAQFEKEKFLIREEAKLQSSKRVNVTNREKSTSRKISASRPNNDHINKVVFCDFKGTDNETSDLETPVPISSTKTPIAANAQNNVFVKNMEERAQKREQLRKEREERKYKEDLEKLKQNEEKEAKSRLVEEEKRRKLNEELKEKRRLERELKLRRDMEREREKINEHKADLFYRKYLLKHYGINGLKKLIHMRNLKTNLAEQAYQTRLLRSTMSTWSNVTRSITDVKKYQADKFYRRYLVKHYFLNGMKALKTCVHLQLSRANRFYIFNLKLKMLRKWVVYKNVEVEKFDAYEIWVGSYATNKVKSKFLRIWKAHPSYMKALREREKRLNGLRSKVQQLIPDFHKRSVEPSDNRDV